MSSFRDLEVWQKSVELTVRMYEITATFPPAEQFGLTSQIRRAAASVPANVAEGQGRASDADFLRHLYIARGSLFELSTHLEVATRLGMLSTPDGVQDAIDEVGRLLNGLIRSLRR